MTRSALAALFTGLLLAAAPLDAQAVVSGSVGASSTKGFFIGAQLNGSAVSAEDLSDEIESGGGLGLQLGYGFSPRLALVLDGTGAVITSTGDEFSLGHFDIALRYAFTGETRRFVPFLEAGISGRAATQKDVTFLVGNSYTTGDLSISGTGLTLGGGAQYYVSPKVALGLGLKWTRGEFSTVKYDNVSVDGLEIDAVTTRFNIGLTWYPMAGR